MNEGIQAHDFVVGAAIGVSAALLGLALRFVIGQTRPVQAEGATRRARLKGLLKDIRSRPRSIVPSWALVLLLGVILLRGIAETFVGSVAFGLFGILLAFAGGFLLWRRERRR